MSDATRTPLTDVRVVEVSDRVAGDYCGKLFVDAGADVLKVEPAAEARCAASRRPVPRRRPGRIRRCSVISTPESDSVDNAFR